jgi:omega-amidase
MPHLKVALVQTELVWEDPAANRTRFDERLAAVDGAPDLVVLPEMFTTGFTMAGPRLAEPMVGPSVEWLRNKAAHLKAHLTGSLIISEAGQVYNRLLWATPGGELYRYDKRHLFRMSGEHRVYGAGRRHLTVTVGAWRVRPFICYDLRFPVWTRNVAQAYDVALFVANWPAARSAHWAALLKARAIENQAYVVGVNRVGRDGNDLAYSGDSMVLDPLGEVAFHAQDGATVQTVALDRAALEDYRQSFPAWRDADTGPGRRPRWMGRRRDLRLSRGARLRKKYFP